VERPGHAVGRDDRAAAGGPADEMAARILHRVPGHALESRLAVLAVPPPRRLRAIDADDRMVNRRAVGLELHRAHEHAGLQPGADHEVPVDVLLGWLDG